MTSGANLGPNIFCEEPPRTDEPLCQILFPNSLETATYDVFSFAPFSENFRFMNFVLLSWFPCYIYGVLMSQLDVSESGVGIRVYMFL